MKKRLIINLLFALPLFLFVGAVMNRPEDAGKPYLATLRSGLRTLRTDQEIHFADNDRYAESLDELRSAGWEGFAPVEPDGSAFSVVMAADSGSYSFQSSYSGMPDVICYSAYGDEVADLPRPAWWDPSPEARLEQCTPGADRVIPGSVDGGTLGFLAWLSIVLVGIVSLVLVVAQIVAEVLTRREKTKAGAKRFLRALGPARVWSVLWVLGYLVLVALVPR